MKRKTTFLLYCFVLLLLSSACLMMCVPDVNANPIHPLVSASDPAPHRMPLSNFPPFLPCNPLSTAPS